MAFCVKGLLLTLLVFLFLEETKSNTCTTNNDGKVQTVSCAFDHNETECLANGCCYAPQTQQFQCGSTVNETAHDEAQCLAEGQCWNATTSQCFVSFNYVISQCKDLVTEIFHQAYNDCIAANPSYCWNGQDCFTEFVPSCYDQNGTVTNSSDCGSSQWRVEFVGKSGQFKFFPCVDSNFFIKVDLLAIQGYDSKGKKTNDKVTSFAYASAEQGTYEASSLFKFSGSNANTATLIGVRLNYTWEISNTPVYMLMYVFVLDNTYQYSSGGQNYVINKDSLKFSYDIVGFPVTADDITTIDLSVRLTTGGNFQSYLQNGTKFSWGENCQTQGCGTFSFEAPTIATIDGQTSDYVNIGFDETGSGKQVTVTFSFQNFADNDNDGLVDISYDPWIGGTYNDGSSSSGSSSFSTTSGTSSGSSDTTSSGSSGTTSSSSSGSSSSSSSGSSSSQVSLGARFYVNIAVIYSCFVLFLMFLF